MEDFPENLTPRMVEGIKSFNLCVFLMGLEGWRRGLNLIYYHDMSEYTSIPLHKKSLYGRSYSLSNKNKIHYFHQSRGDKITKELFHLVRSK